MLKCAITLVPISGPRIEPKPADQDELAAYCNNLIGWHLVVCVGDTNRVKSRHETAEQRSGGRRRPTESAAN